MPLTQTPLQDVLENYRCYLSRNRDLAGHYDQYKRRENNDSKAAEAEAVVFSWLRAEKLDPQLNEDTGKGGPDFKCNPASNAPFLVEVTSLDSDMVAKRSGLPAKITGPSGGAYALITEKLKWKAQDKAGQLAGHSISTASAPKINVPIGGGSPSYITHDYKNTQYFSATPDSSGHPERL